MSENGPYRVKFGLWHERKNDPDYDGERVFINEGIYDEPNPIECVNAELYEIRGDKSPWNLAWIGEIENLSESGENND